ncbi:MAG TPA: hypothetical protein VJ689_05160 [Gaiellaceae bacterium]|nr:hypothetical protein [Gaiellaceae bacterium]
MSRFLAPLALVSVAAATAACAAAAATAPVVPVFVQGLVHARAPGLAFVPTRAVAAYRYERFGASRLRVTYRFRRLRQASGQPAFYTVTARKLAGGFGACAAGKTQTLQMGGNKVYWDGAAAWRCFPAPGGPARVDVTGPAAAPARFASKFAYGRVAASVKRIGT